MTFNAAATILLVDDEAAVVAALRRSLHRGFGDAVAIEGCTSPRQAVERLLARRFDVVVSDLRMPQMDGIELLTRAADIQPDCVRLMLTAATEFSATQRAVNGCGVFRYLTKPWDSAELLGHLREALAHARTLRSQRDDALAWAAHQGQASEADLERRRLEALEPGITRVEWDADGSVVMPPLNTA